MSPHPHKIFKLALTEDAVCSACGSMLCLIGHRPLPRRDDPGLTAWLRDQGRNLTPPSLSAPSPGPGLLNRCPLHVHSVNKTELARAQYTHKLKSLTIVWGENGT